MSLEKKEERGSLKDLGKIKVRTVHYWPVDPKNEKTAGMYETVAGDFIYLNGDPVEDEEIIKATVPEQHRGRALEWLRKRKSGAPVEEPKAEPKPDTELLETIRGISDMVKQMRHEMNVMKGIEPPDPIAEDKDEKPDKRKGK